MDDKNKSPKTIAFFLRSRGYLRVFKSVAEHLRERGFKIVFIFDPAEEKDRSIFAALPTGDGMFTYERGFRRSKLAKKIILPVRELRNYRRFLLVPNMSDFYRRRWSEFLSPVLRHFLEKSRLAGFFLKSLLAGAGFNLFEKLIPVQKDIREQLVRIAPHAFVAAFRGVPSSAPDLDYLKAARKLKISTAILVPSWDSLTTKGQIFIKPDKLIVWNEVQKKEAIIHHGISGDRTVITGSYQFDDWFSRRSRETRPSAELISLGLDPAKPFIIYLGSSEITGDWGESLRKIKEALLSANDPILRATQIIFRPHPENRNRFKNFSMPGIIIAPPIGGEDGLARDPDYFLSTLDGALAAVTINTTGIIDAMIKGVPGIILKFPEFSSLQAAEHFKQLEENSAVIGVRSPADFVAVLSRLAKGDDDNRVPREAFIKKIIRPLGLEVVPGMKAAEEIITLASGIGYFSSLKE